MRAQVVEGGGRRAVAGDHDHASRRGRASTSAISKRVLQHLVGGLRSVRKATGVAEVHEPLARNEIEERAHDGQPAEPAVENADRALVAGRSLTGRTLVAGRRARRRRSRTAAPSPSGVGRDHGRDHVEHPAGRGARSVGRTGCRRIDGRVVVASTHADGQAVASVPHAQRSSISSRSRRRPARPGRGRVVRRERARRARSRHSSNAGEPPSTSAQRRSR